MSDSFALLTAEPPRATPTDDISALVRRIVGSDLTIDSVEVPREPRLGVLTLRGRLNVPSHIAFSRWLDELRPLGYTPMLRHDPLGSNDAVELHIFADVPKPQSERLRVNLVLFLLTIVSALIAGSGVLYTVYTWADLLPALNPQLIIQGWPYALTLLSILLAHEFGHYFAARYHKVAVTLPYFLPMPVGFGTLGAFIRLKEPIPDRRKLFDIGVAGPLAGLVLAIPLLFYGLATSPVITIPLRGIILEGNSILYYLAKFLVFGKTLPNFVTGEDVLLNQVADAAWTGLLVTALNLLPVGQLDGGHTVYSLFGRAARYINRLTLWVMGILAIAGLPFVQSLWPPLANFGFLGWFLWLGLINFVIGPYHPPALDDVTELDARRRWIGYLVILCFILTFVPTPMREL